MRGRLTIGLLVALLGSLAITIPTEAKRPQPQDLPPGLVKKTPTLPSLPTTTLAPTSVPTHTPTPVPPTITPGTGVQLGWHPIGSHDGLNVHEHGEAPPAWVTAASAVGCPAPLTQSRESHQGYKGFVADQGDGGDTQSYMVTHILSSVSARSHGDHDYQLYVREPSGAVSCWQGAMDFGSPPPLVADTDNGQRPIILSQAGGCGASFTTSFGTEGLCETWYTRPGASVMDVGQVINFRMTTFDGMNTGGDGSCRRLDWLIPINRLDPGFHDTAVLSSTLASHGRDHFGANALFYLQNDTCYGDAQQPN